MDGWRWGRVNKSHRKRKFPPHFVRHRTLRPPPLGLEMLVPFPVSLSRAHHTQRPLLHGESEPMEQEEGEHCSTGGLGGTPRERNQSTEHPLKEHTYPSAGNPVLFKPGIWGGQWQPLRGIWSPQISRFKRTIRTGEHVHRSPAVISADKTKPTKNDKNMRPRHRTCLLLHNKILSGWQIVPKYSLTSS